MVNKQSNNNNNGMLWSASCCWTQDACDCTNNKKKKKKKKKKKRNGLVLPTSSYSSSISLVLWVALVAVVGLRFGNGFVVPTNPLMPQQQQRYNGCQWLLLIEKKRRGQLVRSPLAEQVTIRRPCVTSCGLRAVTPTRQEQQQEPTPRQRRRRNWRDTIPLVVSDVLLSAEDEQRLARQIVQAKHVRQKLSVLLRLKQKQQHQQDADEEDAEESFLTDDEFYSKHYDSSEPTTAAATRTAFNYELLERHYQQSILERAEADVDFCLPGRNNILWPQPPNEDASSQTSQHQWSFFDSSSSSSVPQTQYDLDLIQEEDIVHYTGLKGGRVELLAVLRQGALARDELIRSNLRLVSNIALKYAKLAVRGKSTSLPANDIFADGWDRPSVSEAFQDGVLGLVAAVDRFEPQRGLRFSTYATYLITNYVRRSFQVASTGVLRLPTNMYDKKYAYKALMWSYYNRGDKPPAFSEVAALLNVSEERLHTILRLTKPLMSINHVISDGEYSGTYDISSAIVDVLSHDPEDDQVGLPYLRHTLENIMAVVLAPHERDVLRLRLGLDDGEGRTIREIASVYDGMMTPQEIRTTEKKALRKLRTHMLLEMDPLDSPS